MGSYISHERKMRCAWFILFADDSIDYYDSKDQYDNTYAYVYGRSPEEQHDIFRYLQLDRDIKIRQIQTRIRIKYKKEVYDVILNYLRGESSDICHIICSYLIDRVYNCKTSHCTEI